MEADPTHDHPTQLVLHALLTDPPRSYTGMEIGQAAGLPSGTMHPILARIEGAGWLTSRWEDIDPRAEGRPARRYYRLTPEGMELARAALARAYSATARPAWLRPLGRSHDRPVGGPGGLARRAGPPGGPAWWSAPPPCPCPRSIAGAIGRSSFLSCTA